MKNNLAYELHKEKRKEKTLNIQKHFYTQNDNQEDTYYLNKLSREKYGKSNMQVF